MAAVNSVLLGSAEQAGGLDDGQLALACGNHFRRMIKREIEITMMTKEMLSLLIQRLCPMVVKELGDSIRPVLVKELGDSFRPVVQKGIQSGIKKFFAGGNRINTNSVAVSNERSLHLRFLDEVSDDVLTGKDIQGKEGAPIRVAIVDAVTGETIETEPEASAKVEILFLEAFENDSEQNFSHQDFNNRIIKDSDKMKPHFAKSCTVYLKNGIGTLSNAKLANDSNWTKSCKCRLGARVVNLSGTKIQEAWTEPFLVSDSRKKLYEKHHPPSLSDPVWRLEHIGRTGAPCKRLEKDNISTVKDFLFWLSVDCQRLKDILKVTDTAWKAIEQHAGTCKIDDKSIFMYNDSSECNMSVVFDVVGKLKGIIRDSHYVLASSLSKAEKDRTKELLVSAFKNQKDIASFPDEEIFMLQFPYQAGLAPTSALMIHESPRHSLAITENASRCDPTNPVTSSQSFKPFTEQPNADDTLIQQVRNGTNYSAMRPLLPTSFSGFRPIITQSNNHCDSNEPGTSIQGIFSSNGPLGNLSNIIANSRGLDVVVDVGFDMAVLGSGCDELARMFVPQRASNVATNASIQGSFSAHNPTILGNIDRSDPTEPGTSSLSLSPLTRLSGYANEDHMLQAPYRRGFASMNTHPLEGSLGCNETIPNNSIPCDQADPGPSSRNFSASAGPSSNALNTYVPQVPYGTTYAGTSTPIPEALIGRTPTIPVSIIPCESTEPDTSSQGISPSISTLGEAGMHNSKRRRT